jgi:hypothetical protein
LNERKPPLVRIVEKIGYWTRKCPKEKKMPKKKEKNKSRSRGKTLKLSQLQPPTFAQTIRRLTNATQNT